MNIPPGAITIQIGGKLPRVFVAKADGTHAKSAFYRIATEGEIAAGILWAEERIIKLNAQLDIALDGMEIA